ncbi:unnamed protein product [Protopolystoma xenopodis]|uniref:Uncharacterized protein n=1 Tax=Protopolystoma xenopodis TaxID=117903 RepID=A0A3S5ABD8_9PLAT|nr:unnamed protein product [Protopolystoma xenopodis]
MISFFEAGALSLLDQLLLLSSLASRLKASTESDPKPPGNVKSLLSRFAKTNGNPDRQAGFLSRPTSLFGRTSHEWARHTSAWPGWRVCPPLYPVATAPLWTANQTGIEHPWRAHARARPSHTASNSACSAEEGCSCIVLTDGQQAEQFAMSEVPSSPAATGRFSVEAAQKLEAADNLHHTDLAHPSPPLLSPQLSPPPETTDFVLFTHPVKSLLPGDVAASIDNEKAAKICHYCVRVGTI